jgi:guanylate kinase
VLKELKDTPNIHEIISCTSRPIRENEANGINYYFYTADEFINKIYEGEMLEFTNFNNWWYGTSYDGVRSDGVINIGVFNPAGVRQLLDRDDCHVSVFWVRAADKTRLLRQLNRENNPNVKEIIRRFGADEEDFKDIDFDFIEIQNEFWEDFEIGVEAIVSQV